MSNFKEKLEEVKANKEKVYKQMEKEASNPEVQKYYKDNLEEIDLEIIEKTTLEKNEGKI